MADSDGNDNGKADRIYVPNDRIFERTQGCWNCVHFDNGSEAKRWWSERRQRELKKALDVSMTSKLGENHPKVLNIRSFVNKTDHSIAKGTLGRCGTDLRRPGRTADGNPVGELVVHNFLCEKWTAAQGASIARAGQKPDALPEELADKVGNAMPDVEKIADDIKRSTEDN